MAAVMRKAVRKHGAQLQSLHRRSVTCTGSISADLFTTDTGQTDRLQLQGRRSFSAEIDELLSPKVWNHVAARGCFHRGFSQLVASGGGKRLFPVDTLALVKRLESQGLSAKQAEAIIAEVTEALDDSLENGAESFTTKNDVQRSEPMGDAALSKFKGQMQSSEATKQREAERLLRTDIDKKRNELRYASNKVTVGQRLHLTDKSSRDKVTIEEVKDLIEESEARVEARAEAWEEAWEVRLEALAEADALLWAPRSLEVVASQLLVFCLGAQPKASRRSKRFWNARNNVSVNKAAMGLKISSHDFCIRADKVINRQNSGVHFQNVIILKIAISEVIDLIERYPKLRKIRHDEVWFLENHTFLQGIFRF